MNGARKLTQPSVWHLELTGDFASRVDNHCVGISTSLTPDQVLTSAMNHNIMHICQRDGFEFEKDLESAEVLLASPELFREFPIGSVLTPSDLSRVSEQALTELDIKFNSSSEKRTVLDGVNNAMESKGLSKTLIEDVVSVADEMYTNAIYNAPFVDIVTQVNPGISRHEIQVKLDPGKYARLFLAHDESRLLIGIEDPFGSLNLMRWLGKIRETYLRGAAATMNFGPGGAGLGSYIIFNAGSSLYFGVWPGQLTVLCCVIPLGMSYRKRLLLPKHLHWIQR